MEPKIVLASNSPRRREIMEMLPWDFFVEVEEVDETMDESLSLEENLLYLAYKKAERVADRYRDKFVVGGDTIVLVEGKVLGKPRDAEDAKAMLRLISSHTHSVWTGVCVLSGARNLDIRFVEKTDVMMTPMSEREIERYVRDGEPFGKAGSYAIQGKGGVYVEKIDGCYYNVVGLPLNRLYRELRAVIEE